MKRLLLVLSLAMIFGVFAANAQEKPAPGTTKTEQKTHQTGKKQGEKKKVVKKKPVIKTAKSTVAPKKEVKPAPTK
jgi:hypothetical protein